jgi:hypothetical protein
LQVPATVESSDVLKTYLLEFTDIYREQVTPQVQYNHPVTSGRFNWFLALQSILSKLFSLNVQESCVYLYYIRTPLPLPNTHTQVFRLHSRLWDKKILHCLNSFISLCKFLQCIRLFQKCWPVWKSSTPWFLQDLEYKNEDLMDHTKSPVYPQLQECLEPELSYTTQLPTDLRWHIYQSNQLTFSIYLST